MIHHDFIGCCYDKLFQEKKVVLKTTKKQRNIAQQRLLLVGNYVQKTSITTFSYCQYQKKT